jgi:methyl-accepting chemotaxis protein
MELVGNAMEDVAATTQEELKNSENISFNISQAVRALEEISKSAAGQTEMSEEINKIMQQFKLNP